MTKSRNVSWCSSLPLSIPLFFFYILSHISSFPFIPSPNVPNNSSVIYAHVFPSLPLFSFLPFPDFFLSSHLPLPLACNFFIGCFPSFLSSLSSSSCPFSSLPSAASPLPSLAAEGVALRVITHSFPPPDKSCWGEGECGSPALKWMSCDAHTLSTPCSSPAPSLPTPSFHISLSIIYIRFCSFH